jgi:quercetin dioxygenase-like cupin family protein
MSGRRAIATEELVVGEWSLTAAAWTDRHQHEETNWVLEGELHVTSGDRTEVVRAGQVVIIPPGARTRYAAPVHARMLFVYGPSRDGHATADARYEELPLDDPPGGPPTAD